jgi:hypothetical protein
VFLFALAYGIETHIMCAIGKGVMALTTISKKNGFDGQMTLRYQNIENSSLRTDFGCFECKAFVMQSNQVSGF